MHKERETGKYFILIMGALAILTHIGAIFAMTYGKEYGLVPGMSVMGIAVFLDLILFLAVRADNRSKGII